MFLVVRRISLSWMMHGQTRMQMSLQSLPGRSNRLAQDVRQGAHAQKVMASYQSWFGEGPELSVLRLLGLFDRPADEKALGVLLKPPAIPGVTESLTDLRPTAWRTILAKLR